MIKKWLLITHRNYQLFNEWLMNQSIYELPTILIYIIGQFITSINGGSPSSIIY